MKKIFIKKYKEKYYIKKYSWKYYLACLIEIIGIIFWIIGLQEIYLINKTNPAILFINLGGVLFVIGSFTFAKVIKIK